MFSSSGSDPFQTTSQLDEESVRLILSQLTVSRPGRASTPFCSLKVWGHGILVHAVALCSPFATRRDSLTVTWPTLSVLRSQKLRSEPTTCSRCACVRLLCTLMNSWTPDHVSLLASRCRLSICNILSLTDYTIWWPSRTLCSLNKPTLAQSTLLLVCSCCCWPGYAQPRARPLLPPTSVTITISIVVSWS
jgi:hypothetical protein